MKDSKPDTNVFIIALFILAALSILMTKIPGYDKHDFPAWEHKGE